MYRILVIHWSQTGQLTRAAHSMMAPLEERADVEIVWAPLEPLTPYAFPWKPLDFFDVFPESVLGPPPPIAVPTFDPDARYDLVILAYQVWFLSPSLPIAAFLESPASRVLAGKRVITLIVCRNMWLSAQARVKARLTALGARLADNIVLVDQGPAWASFVTTPRWMLTGRRDAFLGLPPAGVSEEDIRGASRFGRAIAEVLPNVRAGQTGPFLSGLRAVRVLPGYIASERLGIRSFRIWARALRALGPPGSKLRRLGLLVYAMVLVVLILTIVPLGLAARAVSAPFLRARLRREVRELEGPSGSGSVRMPCDVGVASGSIHATSLPQHAGVRDRRLTVRDSA